MMRFLSPHSSRFPGEEMTSTGAMPVRSTASISAVMSRSRKPQMTTAPPSFRAARMVSAPLKQEMDGARPPEPRMRVIWAWAFSEANANMILSMEFAPLLSLRPCQKGRQVSTPPDTVPAPTGTPGRRTTGTPDAFRPDTAPSRGHLARP